MMVSGEKIPQTTTKKSRIALWRKFHQDSYCFYVLGQKFLLGAIVFPLSVFFLNFVLNIFHHPFFSVLSFSCMLVETSLTCLGACVCIFAIVLCFFPFPDVCIFKGFLCIEAIISLFFFFFKGRRGIPKLFFLRHKEISL